MTADRAKLAQLADLLDNDQVFDFVMGSIADARDKSLRAPGDRDSSAVLEEVIKDARRAAA